MSVFRVMRDGNFTVMSNCHLRDKRLSLKAKGLLSQMLSLPDDWDYTLAGLVYLNRESKDAIRSALHELEQAGYVLRRQMVDEKGRFSSNEYRIFEEPMPFLLPSSGEPLSSYPTADNPTQQNIESLSTDSQNTELFPILSAAAAERMDGRERMTAEETIAYRNLILKNISYDCLAEQLVDSKEILDEIVELLVEAVCASRKTTRIAGADFPTEVVRSRLLKLNSEHIRYVMDCMKENTTKVRNIKQYLLTALYNAPATMSNYFNSRVNYDMYGTD